MQKIYDRVSVRMYGTKDRRNLEAIKYISSTKITRNTGIMTSGIFVTISCNACTNVTEIPSRCAVSLAARLSEIPALIFNLTLREIVQSYNAKY